MELRPDAAWWIKEAITIRTAENIAEKMKMEAAQARSKFNNG